MVSASLRRLPSFAALLLLLVATSASAQQPAPTPPLLPEPKLTPGDTLDVTLADIRETGYSSRVRNVPVSVKREVYASYGIQTWTKGEYEIDHLIPLSIGGSNSKRNLWPQSYLTQPWNAHVKDRLEYRLLSLVRSGKVDLHTAQTQIASDWIEAYKKYVGPEPKPRGGQRGGRNVPPHPRKAPDGPLVMRRPAKMSRPTLKRLPTGKIPLAARRGLDRRKSG